MLDKRSDGAAITVNRSVDAPSIYADGVLSCSVWNGLMKVSFVEALADDPAQAVPGWKHRIVGTLTMTPRALEEGIQYLTESLEKFRAQGTLPRAKE